MREKMMISRIPYEEKESPGGKFRQPERALRGNAFSYIISARHGSATSSIGSAQARRNRKSVQEYYEKRLLAEDVKKMKAKKIEFFDQAGRSEEDAKVFSSNII